MKFLGKRHDQVFNKCEANQQLVSSLALTEIQNITGKSSEHNSRGCSQKSNKESHKFVPRTRRYSKLHQQSEDTADKSDATFKRIKKGDLDPDYHLKIEAI